ncbi:MAG: GTPase Der [candidate division TM6 bacterium GW2011_GWF2_32_72]|nr:MAG: GTPase Der [candidate division TM6 bacterium GW2011_GWF2_32_72]
MARLNKIIIVGRTNVGKSTLFNRLAEKTRAITLDQEGVTRDFISDVVNWKDASFELYDTGGVSLKSTTDPILEKVRVSALNLIEDSYAVLFVVDGKIGLLPEDRDIAKVLHKTNKPVFLVINKADVSDAIQQLHEFERLGFKESFFVSAQHGAGISELLDGITEDLPHIVESKEEEKPKFSVVLLGKPNVGKSSLMNLLLAKERSIVSDVPGTTREALSEKIQFQKESILLTDTAGIRRKRAVEEPLEEMMVHSSFKAMERADIVLLMLDESEGQVSNQELKLVSYAFENGKAVIVLFNKDDLMDDLTRQDLEIDLEKYPQLFEKFETLRISCKTGKNIGKVLPLVEKVWERYSHEFDDLEVTEFFKEALYKKPLYHNKILLKLYKVRVIRTAPITFLFLVNSASWFGASQLAYFENRLRSKYNLKGVPVRFVVRKRS